MSWNEASMQAEMPKLNSLAHLMIYFSVARLIPDGIGSYGSLTLRGRTRAFLPWFIGDIP
ncbi:hypothetical protein [Marinomonas gallaica]|uniref:hypothetical protein n=1 Tax=Marinomonas gallaica TaxID=1806667 RepID=UPI003A919363